MSIDSNGRYRRGEPGWYVANLATDISNFGPYTTRAAAERQRQRNEAEWGPMPDVYVVQVPNTQITEPKDTA